jgi:outer membrane receptor protein involved in Fe transport
MKKIAGSRSLRLLLTLLFCCLLLSSITAFGQSTTEGAIGGTVVDPQGKVVRAADVTVRNNGSNQAFTAKTNDTGYFRVGQLPPATYTVTVISEGFAPYKAAKVIVTVGSLTAVNAHLTIGSTEQVDVTAETPLINVTSADFAPTLNETAIQNLPINGGRWSSFVMLTPGVVSDSNGFGLVSFRGMSTLLNNVTVDGADNNQAYFSEERGRTRAGYSTAKIAVQEFQVNTSNYSAEYGRSAGGVINTVTKSGTNGIHGEAFWYDRDNNWGSFNPYTTLTSVSRSGSSVTATTAAYKPKDVRKMGGFGVGGPIIKDKLFWFVAYDRFHHNFPGTAVPNNASTFFGMPDAALASGVTCANTTSTADLNVCTMAALLYNPAHTVGTKNANINAVTAAQYATAQPLWVNAMFGNTKAQGNAYDQLGLYSISGSTPRTGDQDIFFPKLDWIINQKNHASFEVNRMRWWSPAGIQTQGTNAYGIESFGNDYVKDTWGIATLDTMLTNSISNQVRFQYGRDFEFENNQTPTAYEQATLINPINSTTGVAGTYTNPLGLPPEVTVGSFQWGTSNFLNRASYPDEYRYQIADTVNYSHGHHNLKFGIDFINTSDGINNLYQQYGQYSYSGVPQYFASLYDPNHAYFTNFYQAFQGNSVSNPVKTYTFTTNDLAFFVQDDYKLSRRLTVNAGLRYEREMMPSPYSDLAMTIPLGASNITTGTMPKDTNNWGPRVGFAYDVFGTAKTVLRGGYGLYFGRIINSSLFSGLINTGSHAGQLAYNVIPTAGAATSATVPTFPQIYTAPGSLPAGSLTIDYFDPKFKAPQVNEIDLTLQQQMGWRTVLSVSYLGSFGRHMQNFTDINFAAPGTPYCVTSTGGQATGTCATPLTPPSTISYTVSNTLSGSTVNMMPVADGKTITVPFYTSRLNTGYGSIIDIYSGVNSSYNALAIQLEKRLSNNVQFSANYTWSHALDYGVNGTTGASSYATVLDPLHPKYGVYGNSLYNVPNRFTVNAVIDAPWKHNGAIKYLLDGWQVSPMLQIQNGLGYSVTTSTATPTQYVGTQPFKGASSGLLGTNGSFQIPGTERNGYLQPNTYVADMRFSKSGTIYERYKLQFSADAFNLFNHRNVTQVNTTGSYAISSPTSGVAGVTTSPTLGPNSSAVANGTALLGVPTSANSNYVYSTRQIQLGLRLSF